MALSSRGFSRSIGFGCPDNDRFRWLFAFYLIDRNINEQDS